MAWECINRNVHSNNSLILLMKKHFLISLLFSLVSIQAAAETVLVTIGKTGQVTDRQLEAAMRAAPFATQFPSMDEKDQAYLRGDMLLRLARAEALYLEAIARKIPESAVFQQEMSNFKTSLLAQRYLLNLGKTLTIPEDIAEKLEANSQNNSDALKAARSAYIAKQFKQVKADKLKALRQAANIQTHFDRLPGADQNTLLAEGKNLSIRYGDLVPENASNVDAKQIQEKVEQWIDLILMARSAEASGVNIAPSLKEYGRNLAVRILLAQKEKQWIPDEKTLLDYFQRHPKIGYIPERRQIGQIVLASQQEAETMRQKIVGGESLFTLAGLYSIDPYGRQRSGDMGWLTEGSASPEIEKALKSLKDNEISPVIKTAKGWHIITIVNRKPAEQKSFDDIKDRVRQKLLAEKMTDYIQQVTARYPLKWLLPDKKTNQ